MELNWAVKDNTSGNSKDARLKGKSRRPLQIQHHDQLLRAGGTPAVRNLRLRLAGSMELNWAVQRQHQRRRQRRPPQRQKQAAATLRFGTAESQDESRCCEIHKFKSRIDC